MSDGPASQNASLRIVMVPAYGVDDSRKFLDTTCCDCVQRRSSAGQHAASSISALRIWEGNCILDERPCLVCFHR